MDMKQLFERQLDRNGKLIASVEGGQLSGSTPCKDFDTRALLNHIVGGNHFFVDLAEQKLIDVNAPQPDLIGDDPARAYEQSKARILEKVRDPGFDETNIAFPFGAMPGSMAIGIMLMEVTVHGWDLAKALGRDATIDAEIAAAVLPGAQMIPPEMKNAEGNPFGPAVQVPDNAPPADKLVAVLGRQP